jgi:hypothetical protein
MRVNVPGVLKVTVEFVSARSANVRFVGPE